MCNTVLIGDREITSLRELRNLVGAENVIIDDGYDVALLAKGDCCLCPVDLEATAARAGYLDSRDKHDGMQHIWTKS